MIGLYQQNSLSHELKTEGPMKRASMSFSVPSGPQWFKFNFGI